MTALPPSPSLSGSLQAEGACMRRKLPAFPSVSAGTKHTAPPANPPALRAGGARLLPARDLPSIIVLAGAEPTRGCCIIYHSSFQQRKPLNPTAGAPRPLPPDSLPGRATRTKGEETAGAARPPLPPRGAHPAHLDPLHGRLQPQLLHQPLHGAQAAARRHRGLPTDGRTDGEREGRKETAERLRSARLGLARINPPSRSRPREGPQPPRPRPGGHS